MRTGSYEELYSQFQSQLKFDKVLGQQAVQQVVHLQNTIEVWDGVCKKAGSGSCQVAAS